MAYCPLVCHDTVPTWPLLTVEVIYWRLLVAGKLNSLPLFSAWPLADWQRWLVEQGQPDWLTFPCLARPPYQLACDQYTVDLLAAGIIKRVNQQIVLFRHPYWFNSLADKLALL